MGGSSRRVVVVAVLGIGLGLHGCAGGHGGGSQGIGGAPAGGATAAAGGVGAAGASGAAGTAGAAGGVGAAGASGAAGTAGAAGSTGAAGRGGTGGQTGAAGTAGTMVTGAGGAFCGNGVVDPGEGCDDGNAQTADGCSPTCRKIVGLPVGYGPPCVLLDDGAVKCWGYNYYGELGLGDMVNRGIHVSDMGANLPAVDLGTGRRAVALTAGAGNGTCALLDNATVKCWGPNSVGNLGLGDKNPHGDMPGEMGDNLPAIDLGTGHTAKAIASSGFHTCAILENGSVKCWGTGVFGALGLGSTASHGDAAGEMGDNLPTVDLGTGRTAKAIAAGGGAHTCAILDDDTVKCWGDNAFGELGLGDKKRRGDMPGQMGDNLPTVDLGTGRTARSLSLGESHSCAILDDGSAKCWGGNGYGVLGLPDENARGDDPGEMGDNLPAIKFGTGRTAKTILAGQSDTCAILDDATIKCWGSGRAGELGSGDTATHINPPSLLNISVGTGRTVKQALAWDGGTCALLDNATLKCWGENTNGELGIGDFNRRGDGPGEMGDNLPAVILP